MNIFYISKSTCLLQSTLGLLLLCMESSTLNFTIDDGGYVVYCPCMGRFGNQADHFLGALGFAKGLSRTLVLPPWVEYRYGESRSIQVPFDSYFEVEALQEFHKVITMENFMKYIAPTVWPPDKRIAFCYVGRGSEVKGCNAKEGNPFGPFWDTFDVDFIGSEFYSPLHYDVHHSNMPDQWNAKYQPSQWPVLAFTGAPASFPVQLENRHLHQYLKWNKALDNAANNFIKTELPKGGFIGIHLRNGIDWVRACEHIKTSPNLFSAPQCLGYRNEYGAATREMCFPTLELIVKQLKRLIRDSKDIRSIFVASDSNHMITELSTALRKSEISVLKLKNVNPHLDLAILGRANYFIGNCISSFSAFAKRERDVRKFPSAFWGFPPLRNPHVHSEL